MKIMNASNFITNMGGRINTNSKQYKAAMKMLNAAWAQSPQMNMSEYEKQLTIKKLDEEV